MEGHVQAQCGPVVLSGGSCSGAIARGGIGAWGFLILQAALSLFFCCVLNAQPLFPPQSTVILFTGVPGDMESDTAYREQLHAWSEIAAASGAIKRLFILCDDPVAFQPALGTNAVVLPGNRAQFLGLGQKLAGQTNALTCIAWGHGGKQGSLPVFHVRGPRLTAADFKAVADQIPAASSQWILFFRGSGAFASQLAAQQRQILASEKETEFTSDPIGMSVLLKLARNQADGSFSTISGNLGQGVQAWYQERNLARTEEPAFWNGAGQPRSLAQSAEEVSARVANPGTNTAAPTNVPAAAAAALPPVWKQIQKVDPKQFPEADGVLLRRRLTYTLGANPAISSDSEVFIQVLSAEGKHLGDFDISYSPPGEDIDFVDCEVLSPDGKLTRLDPEAVREARHESIEDYSMERRKFFSLPGVVPGAVLRMHYQTRWKQFPMPYYSLEIPLAQELPTIDSVVEVGVSKEMAFHFALDRIEGADPTVKQASYGTTYTWQFKDLPAQANEVLGPPQHDPRLIISTFPDWAAFGEWYGRISRLTDAATPELAAKAKELTAGAATDRDKIVALYNYVTALRYVAVPLGVNSFRPHAAANVLQNQFGDCKDKANLFNALLHAADIPAHLVLVPRFSQAYDELPGFAFNHAISRVMLQGQVLWVDTTDDVCRFGMLPPGDSGRKVLVVDGRTTNLTRLPQSGLSDQQLALTGELQCAADRESFPVSLQVRTRGFADYQLRQTAREVKERGASLPLLAAVYRPVAGGLALEKQSSSSVSALGEDFSWQAQGEWVGLISKVGGKRGLQAPFWLPKEWDLALHRRKAALFLNQGYPLALDQQFKFAALSAGAVSLPAPSESGAEPLRWRLEWEKLGDGALRAHFHAELVRGELSPAETALFQQQLRALLAALACDNVELRQP